MDNIRDIDGTGYRVNMMDPFDALDLVADVAEIAGPLISGLTSVGSITDMLDADTSDLDIGGIVKGFTGAINKKKLRVIVHQMMGLTYVIKPDGGPVKLTKAEFTVLFQGKLMAMFEWLWFALEVQLGNFFGDLLGKAKEKMAGAGEASPSPSTSPDTGLAGES